MDVPLAVEALKKAEQVAPKAAEVVEHPVPVAPIKEKKNRPKAAEADQIVRSLAYPKKHMISSFNFHESLLRELIR